MEEVFTEIQIPQQKTYDGIRVPAVVSPSPATCFSSLSDLTKSLQNHKQFLESLLLQSGALLFRGFPLKTASDFNNFVEAFGYEELPYIGGAPRVNVVGRVFTANEAPADQKISFHHEMSQLPEFPSKLFFFCEVEPKIGGETPIVLSHIAYERIKEKHPEFVERLERHGLINIRVLGEDDNPSSPAGRGWKTAFSTNDKTIAKMRAAKLGMKLEWVENGLKTIIGPLAAIKYDETRKRNIWFNSLMVNYVAWENEQNGPIKGVSFGDGQPLPGDIVHNCLKMLEEESIAIPWKKGDVMLIDNLAVLHSRNSFVPPRRILASLVK